MTKKLVLKLKNRLLAGLTNWLQGLNLAGRESRERTRFLALLIERLTEIDKVRTEILNKYAKIEKKSGNYVREKAKVNIQGTEIERMVIQFKSKEDEGKAKTEWDEYMAEEFVIDVSEGNKAKVYTVRDLILDTEEKFQGEMATLYDEWCQIFEQLPDRRKV